MMLESIECSSTSKMARTSPAACAKSSHSSDGSHAHPTKRRSWPVHALRALSASTTVAPSTLPIALLGPETSHATGMAACTRGWGLGSPWSRNCMLDSAPLISGSSGLSSASAGAASAMALEHAAVISLSKSDTCIVREPPVRGRRCSRSLATHTSLRTASGSGWFPSSSRLCSPEGSFWSSIAAPSLAARATYSRPLRFWVALLPTLRACACSASSTCSAACCAKLA
mmetsp:Transcript_47688/g.119182  ORF Transcript_47688/g.119182 Transcript_47688/m.119182 type:complete len:228 (-) Transcript_47688:140-823(-)